MVIIDILGGLYLFCIAFLAIVLSMAVIRGRQEERRAAEAEAKQYADYVREITGAQLTQQELDELQKVKWQ